MVGKGENREREKGWGELCYGGRSVLRRLARRRKAEECGLLLIQQSMLQSENE